MSTLYEISDRYLAALDAATDPDSNLSVDDFADTINGLEGELENKLIAVLCYAEDKKATGEAIRASMERQKRRADAAFAAADRLMEYVKEQMNRTGITKVECAAFAARIQKNPPRVVVDNE